MPWKNRGLISFLWTNTYRDVIKWHETTNVWHRAFVWKQEQYVGGDSYCNSCQSSKAGKEDWTYPWTTSRTNSFRHLWKRDNVIQVSNRAIWQKTFTYALSKCFEISVACSSSRKRHLQFREWKQVAHHHPSIFTSVLLLHMGKTRPINDMSS